MAVDASLPGLLTSLTASISSASTSLPSVSAIVPPKDGISLLDTKSELLLSYLQNLVFLIILKLRNHAQTVGTADRVNGAQEKVPNGKGGATETQLADEVVKKLVELRVYIERGVRPLEGRLKYQIDKVLRAADDVARSNAQKDAAAANGTSKSSNATGGKDSEEEEEEDDDDDEDDETAAGAGDSAAKIDDLSYRPNPSSFARPSSHAASTTQTSASTDGIYRPPRITPTALPTTGGPADRATARAARPQKSATLDEFISAELSTTPLAEPSIGSTIVSGGRRSKSTKERADEAERQAYEESNFVRLPKESKKDRAKKGGRKRENGYGGEEWRGLGEGIERIERLTRKGKGGGGGAGGLLERSRKRERDTVDGARGSGAAAEGAGERFEKRRKMLGRRNRG
ncbi:MAG: hypothetical protein M1819_003464 [Sarea resinae]|nr:MAG: hypothetical protein M1819_003464 [Sarea resinae]